MKVLGLATTLLAMTLSVSAMADSSRHQLKLTSLSDKAQKLEYGDTTLIRSLKGFSTRAEAQNFCKSEGAALADSMEILAAIVLNNDVGGQEINAGLNDTASYLVLDTASGEKSSGFISWLSDEELKEKSVPKDAEIILMADGGGFSSEATSMKRIKDLVTTNGLSFDKNEIVAFCKK